MTVSVGTRTIIGVVIQALAVITSVENWAGEGSVGCIGYLTVRALASGYRGSPMSGGGGILAYVRLGSASLYPMGDGWVFLSSKPWHGGVEMGNAVAQEEGVCDGDSFWAVFVTDAVFNCL